MLTNAAVKAARPRARAYRLHDEAGLYLQVAPTGSRSFRMRFRWQGHEQLVTFGQWPEVTLADARERTITARAAIARGVDPRSLKHAAATSTFEAAALAWIAHARAGWTERHADDVATSLERDVFPELGALALDAIDAPDVLRVLRLVERRGARETARRLRQRIAGVFAYAQSEGWCRDNPALVTRGALAAATTSTPHPALVDPAELRALLAAAELVSAGSAVKLASRLLALTAVRLDAVRGARWDEIEDLDGDAPLWRVPAARMKLRAARKLDAGNDHLVPLSAAAVAVLRAARQLGAGPLIFPGRGAVAPIGERAILDLYARTSFAGRHVPHGWRASFSTVMNEAHPDWRGAIDQALAHVLKREDGSSAKVEGAYNRAQHLDLRRRVLDAWAQVLAG